MAMTSSQNIRSESEMVPELRRPVMPIDLFRAVMKGDGDVLIRRLGLQPEEQTECQITIEASHSAPQEINTKNQTIEASHSAPEEINTKNQTIEASHSAPEEINTKNQTVQSELQCVTRFGDTILHLLITEGHNELALMVFQRDMSLLKARNNILETPLYCAAKVGNENVIHNLIQRDCTIVKEALEERTKRGDTALHVAAKHDNRDISRMLMKLDEKLAYKVNDEMEYPLYMAIIEGHTEMVQTMLEVDPTLAGTPFSDGMFPVHEAAHMDNDYLVVHFIKNYPDDAQLRDPHGRNFFHVAAEENKGEIFTWEFKNASQREMLERMNTATNYEGNTPFHIAAMKGHKKIMRAIWERYQAAETVPNKKGDKPLKLSAKQLAQNNEYVDNDMIDEYLKTHEDYKFTEKWFHYFMEPPLENKWERTQVIGLGAVLITTVAFAASFTIPGGYNQDNGTPVLGRRYMFRAFILANAMAFLLGFLSLFSLILNSLRGRFDNDGIPYATYSFLYAASSMVVAFGLGLYVTLLAPVCYPIAVLLLVITLFVGSPAVYVIMFFGKLYTQSAENSSSHITCFLGAAYAACFLIIFCLPFM